MSITPFELEAIFLSLKVSAFSMVVSLPVGILTAWILARYDFPGKSLLDGLIHLPLVVPPVVTGYVLLIVMGKQGMLGSLLFKYFGIVLAFNWKGAVLAAAVVAFPLMVRAIRLSIESIDSGLEKAARTLGATHIHVFLTVTIPLALPGILAGSILTFARSLSEFGATITFVSNIPGQTSTIPLALFNLTQIPGGESGAARLCAISIGIAMLALLSSEIVNRRLTKRLRG